ncbi:MAG: CopG family transcriptional regulator [Anaerolinea sp.]|jgi:hypothetical protein|nr:CopG family transcriptional regulator [Anaerolinea sp.]
MRTTIRISDTIYRRVKARAAESGRTVGAIIEDAVRVALEPPRAGPGEVPPLPTFGGSGLMPGVELTSNAALRDLMEQETSIDALR